MKKWFDKKTTNIHEYTIPLEVLKHRSIHNGPNGGPWNAAWDKFIRENDDATKEEIFRYAGQLIYEFELFGPVVPYWRQPPPIRRPGDQGAMRFYLLEQAPNTSFSGYHTDERKWGLPGGPWLIRGRC